ncbi:MAG: AcvB/VirJ family lysyl-phosphatidylglycerol hydrolase [Deltaproteobacteria bacterium]
MKRQYRFAMVLFLVVLLTAGRAMADERMQFGRFGTVTIYRPVSEIQNVALFVSGDGGWNLGVIDMAKALASLGTLVVGIDITHYLKDIARGRETCTYAAADFEELSHYLQKRLNLPHYLPPLLVGYSSGATLAYAVLVQAPIGTFQGAISLGFCPDLPLSKPFCRGNGLEAETGPKGKGFSFLPAPHLKLPWVALQGTIDQVCDATETKSFVQQTGNAQLVMLPKVGHGFSVQKN